jgi:hypothetical protein
VGAWNDIEFKVVILVPVRALLQVSFLQEFQISLILKNFQTAGTALASTRGPAGNHTTAIAHIELNVMICMPLSFKVVWC